MPPVNSECLKMVLNWILWTGVSSGNTGLMSSKIVERVFAVDAVLEIQCRK